jgi:Peptidase family M23
VRTYLLKSFYILHFTFYILHSVSAQYYQYPIKPGQKGSLAGVLGDLRTNHFHAGIDIRTEQREGLEVLAAADGYVSKIKVQTNGYGNVLFIKHPNGQTTVYGHLKKFNDPIADYVRAKQYEWKTFEIEIKPSEGQFVFRKGEMIALSGNTGGSAGPHLHFEIRDQNDNHLNPLEYGFDEIEDTTPPFFQSLAFRPTTLNSRVNGEFERVSTRPIRQRDGTYLLSQPIIGYGQIGLELVAFDFMDGVQFRNGVNCVEIKMDGREVFNYTMSSFPSTSTRDYNNLIDYSTEQKQGIRFLKCYNPDGNEFDLFKTNSHKGKLSIADTLEHEVQITLFDSYENSSVLFFVIKGQIPESNFDTTTEALSNPTYLRADATENVLKISAFGVNGIPVAAQLFTPKGITQIEPAYRIGYEVVYLYDLRNQLADSVRISNKVLNLNYQAKIFPQRLNTYNGNNYSINFSKQSIFDTLYLTSKRIPNGLVINDPTLPLRDEINVNFTPVTAITNPQRTHAYRKDDGRLRFQGGKWRGQTLDFSTRELGTFVLATDTVPPRIRIDQANKKNIVAHISDSMSGIDKFNVFVNDQWVLMNYDYKRALIWSEKQVDSLDFEGAIRVEITDRAGNLATLESEIKEVVIKKAVRPKKKVKNIAKPKKRKR